MEKLLQLEEPSLFYSRITERSIIMSKTWLITGASAGLGRLMTERLLTRGDRVVGHGTT